MIFQKGLAPFLTGQLICKDYGATVQILMKLAFVYMVPLHRISTVFGWLLSFDDGSLLWFASLGRTYLRHRPTSVVRFQDKFFEEVL
jgi:hypothetical protein